MAGIFSNLKTLGLHDKAGNKKIGRCDKDERVFNLIADRYILHIRRYKIFDNVSFRCILRITYRFLCWILTRHVLWE